MPRPLPRLIAPSLLAILGLSACDKPEKPHPQGPGVTVEAKAKTIEQVPAPKLAAGMSKLTPEQQATPVATIGSRTLTLGELEAKLERQPEPVRLQYGTVAKRREFLLNWVQAEVLADEAVRQGFDKDPEVLETLRGQLVRRFLEEAVVDKVKLEDVTPDEVKAYYDANLRLYQRPASVEVRHLLVADEAKARKLRDEIIAAGANVPAKIVGFWQDYVGRHSEDASTRERLGSLGLIWEKLPPGATPEENTLHETLPSALRTAALQLDAFQISQPVRSERGWHLLLAISKSPPLNVPIVDVETQVRSRLLKRKRDQARNDLVRGLVDKAKIELNDEAIGLLPAPTPKQRLPDAHGKGDGHDHGGHVGGAPEPGGHGPGGDDHGHGH